MSLSTVAPGASAYPAWDGSPTVKYVPAFGYIQSPQETAPLLTANCASLKFSTVWAWLMYFTCTCTHSAPGATAIVGSSARTITEDEGDSDLVVGNGVNQRRRPVARRDHSLAQEASLGVHYVQTYMYGHLAEAAPHA